VLSRAEAAHARKVLRLRPGDEVMIFDGGGRTAEAQIADFDGGAARLNVLRERHVERVQPALHVIVALIKGERFDWLVQKATELGAASIRPVAAARSIIRLDIAAAEKRVAKWRSISVEAAKQCGHVVLPEIYPVTAPGDAFRAAPDGLRGLPVLHLGGQPLREFFAGGWENVTFAIGPEGDWTAEEMEAAGVCGFVPLDLGVHVLRSETAALHVLSSAAHHFLGGVGGLRKRP
jgi:16S rRNA (uracil1498-N3)-methyltransferase